jgi:hypothetical protein
LCGQKFYIINKTMKAFGKLLFHLLDGVWRRCGCDGGEAEKLIEVDDSVLSGLHWIDGDVPCLGRKVLWCHPS